mmetsp:Transcript_9192/g.27596  ORF Transcript_9192/g.27596 Transcript_9192/m.27596 type:complete len:243 (+) Transcript_9192:359-1087(+)
MLGGNGSVTGVIETQTVGQGSGDLLAGLPAATLLVLAEGGIAVRGGTVGSGSHHSVHHPPAERAAGGLVRLRFADPTQTGGAECVLAARNGDLQGRIEADVALVSRYAGRTGSSAEVRRGTADQDLNRSATGCQLSKHNVPAAVIAAASRMVLGSGCEVGLGRALVCRRRHVSTQCLRRRCRGGAAPRQRVRRVQPTAAGVGVAQARIQNHLRPTATTVPAQQAGTAPRHRLQQHAGPAGGG